MRHDHWGERRAGDRSRRRTAWIAGTGTLLSALPFALHYGAKHYAATGGAMPDGRFPMWIPVAFWVAAITVAIVGAMRLYRLSDEVERRRLLSGGAGAGAVLVLLLPPVVFLDVLHGGAVPLVWLAAVATGLTIVARPRFEP